MLQDGTMSRRSSHVHARKYFGELDASLVVSWLNSKRRPPNDPVEKLIDFNRQLPIQVKEHQVETYLADIVRKTGFAVAPVLVSAKPNRWRMKWNPVGTMDSEQYLALWKLLHLAEKGLIGKLKECAKKSCGRWFYARFKHQRFDSEKCQQETFKTNPEWRKKRARYMKQLRREKKAGKQ